MRRHIRGGVIAAAASAAAIGGIVVAVALPHYTHSDLRYLDGGTATGCLLLGLLFAYAGNAAIQVFSPPGRTPRRAHQKQPDLRPAIRPAPTPLVSRGGLAELEGYGRWSTALQAALSQPVQVHLDRCGKRL